MLHKLTKYRTLIKISMIFMHFIPQLVFWYIGGRTSIVKRFKFNPEQKKVNRFSTA